MTIEEIRQKKKELGYSYETISQLSGVPLPTVQKVLGGITKSPRHATILALEKVFTSVEDEKRPSFRCPEHNMNEFQGVRETGDPYGGYQFGNTAKNTPHYLDSYPRIPWKRQGEYTAEDRDSLPDDVRTELIDGVLYDMAAPSMAHQIIIGELFNILYNQIDKCGKNCLPVVSPSDVHLDRNGKTVVQPDIYVICEIPPDLTDKGYYQGGPSMVIEVLSPATRSRDLFLKAFKYRAAGVREYWLVDPEKRIVIAYEFDRDSDLDCENTIYGFDDTVPVKISEGMCSVDFGRIKGRLEQFGF